MNEVSHDQREENNYMYNIFNTILRIEFTHL